MTRRLDGLSLLVLDDDPFCLEEISEFLELHGIDHVAASHPSGAIAAMSARRDPGVDVFVVVMELPQMSGLDFVCRHFGADFLEKTVIITGHYGHAEDIRRRYGRRPLVLKKPLSLLTLEAAIASAAGRV
jgi:DNA-binding NarL/FixJ family response regulator